MDPLILRSTIVIVRMYLLLCPVHFIKVYKWNIHNTPTTHKSKGKYSKLCYLSHEKTMNMSMKKIDFGKRQKLHTHLYMDTPFIGDSKESCVHEVYTIRNVKASRSLLSIEEEWVRDSRHFGHNTLSLPYPSLIRTRYPLAAVLREKMFQLFKQRDSYTRSSA